jgi:hypothetical protein
LHLNDFEFCKWVLEEKKRKDHIEKMHLRGFRRYIQERMNGQGVEANYSFITIHRGLPPIFTQACIHSFMSVILKSTMFQASLDIKGV